MKNVLPDVHSFLLLFLTVHSLLLHSDQARVFSTLWEIKQISLL